VAGGDTGHGGEFVLIGAIRGLKDSAVGLYKIRRIILNSLLKIFIYCCPR